MTPIKLDADSQGFLKGQPLGDDTAQRMLAGIRGDTSKILALMRQTASRGGAGRGAGVSAARAARAPLGPVAVPVGRAGAATARMRDASGRFVAGSTPGGTNSATSAARAERSMAETAGAAQAMARIVEAQRRDARADRNQARGADGRFGSGGRGGGGGGGAVGSALAAGGAALQGGEQIDPLLGAIGEMRGVFSGAQGIVSPLGRAGAGLFGGGGAGPDEPVGWLRRMWRELRAGRKEEAKASRDLLRGIKDTRRAGESGGGGILGMLAGLLPSLTALGPAIAAVTGGLASLAALLAGLKRGIPGLPSGAGAGAGRAAGVGKGLLRRVPLLGALVEAVTGVVEDQRIAHDETISDAERRLQRAENAGSTGGALAGAAAGAAGGSFLGPAGTLVGAVGGGIAGSSAGKWVGKKALAGWDYMRDMITGASNKAGVDPGLVAKIAAFESGFDPNAKSPYSSAHGVGQFIDSTWIETVRKHGARHGVAGAAGLTDQQALALRSDPKLQSAMLAELTRENVARGRALGGKDDAANAYAMHNLGAGDGAKFLKALQSNPGASIASILSSRVIANNPSLYGDGSRTVGDAYAAMSTKMALGESFAISARAASSPAAVRASAVPAIAPMSAPGAAPSLDGIEGSRLDSRPPAVVATPLPAPAQDVRDRTIAHIVSGGIGGASPHR